MTQQTGTRRLASGQPVLNSVGPIDRAWRLSRDSSQPLGAPKFEFRELSPPSVFLDDATAASSLQDHLSDFPDVTAPSRPPVRRATPRKRQSKVPLNVIRIDPLRVSHHPDIEREIEALEPPLRSVVVNYSGDLATVQRQVLDTILAYLRGSPSAQICGLQRRDGLPNGGIVSVTCFVCPPDERCCFANQNPVRMFAEHLMHDHLKVGNPFICFAKCGKTFPYSQDRDRHEKGAHVMYRPKAYDAWLTKIRQLGPPEPKDPKTSPSPTPSSSKRSITRSPATRPRLRTPVAPVPYPSVQQLRPPRIVDVAPTTRLLYVGAEGPPFTGNTLPPGVNPPHHPFPFSDSYTFMQYAHPGDNTQAGPHYPPSHHGPAGYGPLHHRQQDMMPLQGQHDIYGSYGLAQFDPGFNVPMYPHGQQQPPQLQGGSLQAGFHQNASASSSGWSHLQNGPSAMSYTAPSQAQMQSHQASITTPNFNNPHGATANVDNRRMYSSRTSNSASNALYTTQQNGNGISQYNQAYNN